MNARLIILILLAGGLAVFFAVRSAAPGGTDSEVKTGTLSDEQMEKMAVRDTPIEKRPLPGSEPDVPPVFDVRVEVDPSGNKNRLFLYVSEEHGYYVEALTITIRHFETPDLEWEDGTYITSTYVQDIIKANETLRVCADITNNELEAVGGVMGDSSNWRAEVTKYGRARARNPEKFPLVDEIGKCR